MQKSLDLHWKDDKTAPTAVDGNVQNFYAFFCQISENSD